MSNSATTTYAKLRHKQIVMTTLANGKVKLLNLQVVLQPLLSQTAQILDAHLIRKRTSARKLFLAKPLILQQPVQRRLAAGLLQPNNVEFSLKKVKLISNGEISNRKLVSAQMLRQFQL